MATFSFVVKSRLVGSGTFGPPIVPVELEADEGEALTIEQLIELAVAAQIRAMDAQTDLDPEEVRGAFERHYGRLPGDDPNKQDGSAATVPENPGGAGGAQLIDPTRELANAKRAVDTGRIAIVADGKQVEGLNSKLEIAQGSKVTFLRMIQVAGG